MHAKQGPTSSWVVKPCCHLVLCCSWCAGVCYVCHHGLPAPGRTTKALTVCPLLVYCIRASSTSQPHSWMYEHACCMDVMSLVHGFVGTYQALQCGMYLSFSDQRRRFACFSRLRSERIPFERKPVPCAHAQHIHIHSSPNLSKPICSIIKPMIQCPSFYRGPQLPFLVRQTQEKPSARPCPFMPGPISYNKQALPA